MQRPGVISFLLLALMASSALAAEQVAASADGSTQELETLTVSGIKDPSFMPWRKALKALEAFDRHHELAPAAAPRFILTLLPKQNDSSQNPLTLRLADNESSLDIPIAADGTFALPRNQQKWGEEAEVILNRKKGLYQPFPDIHSPNVPANTRRLGDLRLQCEMLWAVAKDDLGFLARTAYSALGGLCHTGLARIGFRAPRPLAGATLVAAGRREALEAKRIGPEGRFFAAPLHDTSWPDDTLVEFNFAPAADPR